ncbi:indole-3-glycerol phosphate synthase TrpC [[Clostridium] leptum]|nr:indole-3-glycerol phosphate synthase TrpC [[Clostridium] leptum]
MILDDIVAKKEVRLHERMERIPLLQLQRQAGDRPRMPLDFAGSLKLAEKMSIIAEVKKASPSKGVIRSVFNPTDIANSYLRSDVQAMSILTEEDYFQGNDAYLQSIRAISPIPLLRKDFIISEYQIYEAYLLGADAILLIAAILDQRQLVQFQHVADSLGLSCLVEVHDKEELERVLDTEAPVVGINNRNLRTFEVTLRTCESLIPHIPKERCIVAESGIGTAQDVRLLRSMGADAILVGETFMRSDDIPKAVQMLRGEIH